MKEKQENCYICGKKLNFWLTASRKVDGMKVCTSCHFKRAKVDWDKDIGEVKNELKKVKLDIGAKNQGGEDLATRINRVGMRLTINLTLPIILFFIGIFTFPIGLLFWLLGLVLLAGLFKTDQK